MREAITPLEQTQSALEVQVHLKEYEKIRDVISDHLKTRHQVLLLVLGSASFAIPFLLSKAADPNDQQSLAGIAAGLYALSIVFSIIGAEYAASGYYVEAASSYIEQYIQPKLNNKLGAVDEDKVMQFEHWVREDRGKPYILYLTSVGTIGIGALMIISSISAISAASSIQMQLKVPAQQPGQSIPFLFTIQDPLWKAAIVAISASILSQICGVIYAMNTGYMRSKENQTTTDSALSASQQHELSDRENDQRTVQNKLAHNARRVKR